MAMIRLFRRPGGRLGAGFILAAALAAGCAGSDDEASRDGGSPRAAREPAAPSAADPPAAPVASLPAEASAPAPTPSAPAASPESAGARRREIQANQARLAENDPPVARLDVRPREGWAGLTMLHYDTGDCTDEFTRPGALLKRYDFDGDGVWDTGLQRGARVGHVLARAGTFRPRVLVKDTGGLVDSAVAAPIVIHPPCPPPDFALADVNPHSPTRGRTLRLADQRGRPVLAWVVTLST